MINEGATNVLKFFGWYWLQILCVIALVVVVEVANDYVSLDRPVFSFAGVGLLVAAFSFFLVFRVNEAYSRWWEARTLWGQCVNSSRSFARQVTTLIIPRPGDEDSLREVEALRRELVHRHIAYVNALRMSLRRQDDWDELEPLLPPGELEALASAANKPTQILQRQGARLADARRAGILSDFGLVMLDATLATLHDVQGGCERIKNTVFPDRVAFLTQFTAWTMASFLAITLIDPHNEVDLIDMFVVPFMMTGFIVTERVGTELKKPFENRPNDTPMTALCRTIEIDLRQQLGEKDLPPPIESHRGVLM